MQRLQTHTRQRGRHLVLIIALSKYKPKFKDLRYTLEDAEIYEKFAIEELGVDKKDITVLLDEGATSDKIDYHLQQMQSKVMKWDGQIH